MEEVKTERRVDSHLGWGKTFHEGRECGTCYACCVWLGIEELHKYTGEKCKNLRSGAYPTKRCGIYSKRPSACSTYKCLWRAGWGPDNLRPNEAGLLITPYDGDAPDTASITINVFDQEKADPHIEPVLAELLTNTRIKEVRLVFLQTKKANLFRDGNIYQCRLLPSKNYESLTFEAQDEPIGHYRSELLEEIPDATTGTDD